MALADLLRNYIIGFLAALTFLTIVFVVAHRSKRYDLIDSAWGVSCMVITLTSLALHTSTISSYKIVVTGLLLLWGMRLSWHIFGRFRRSSEQDKRYTTLMQSWSGHLGRNAYLRIYVVQALLASLVSLPILISITEQEAPRQALFIVGLALWLFGFLFEAAADAQLKHFSTQPNNKGKLLQSGLWAYSRHPNYFGEITLWWGFAIMALSVPYGWIGLIGGGTITYLIVCISGLPPSEAHLATRQGWTEYARSTSPLIPWPRRGE